jgi:hypothetical protein
LNDPLQHGELQRRHRSVPPPPPPPLTAVRLVPLPELPPASASEAQRLQADLEAARAELAALEDLLEELPGIFEAKFRQRLLSLLDQQHLLAEENRQLRERLLAPARPEPTRGRLLPRLPQWLPRRAAQRRLGNPHT